MMFDEKIDWEDCANALEISGAKGATWTCKPEVATGLAGRLRRLADLERKFDVRRWTPTESRAWHAAIPDTSAAFKALLSADNSMVCRHVESNIANSWLYEVTNEIFVMRCKVCDGLWYTERNFRIRP